MQALLHSTVYNLYVRPTLRGLFACQQLRSVRATS